MSTYTEKAEVPTTLTQLQFTHHVLEQECPRQLDVYSEKWCQTCKIHPEDRRSVGPYTNCKDCVLINEDQQVLAFRNGDMPEDSPWLVHLQEVRNSYLDSLFALQPLRHKQEELRGSIASLDYKIERWMEEVPSVSGMYLKRLDKLERERAELVESELPMREAFTKMRPNALREGRESETFDS